MSIQVAILKILASHGNGRATLASLRHDIVILTTSGDDWTARLKRLASRVPSIDVFGSGYVLRDQDGWEITSEGRKFLRTLESVTQDNLVVEAESFRLPAVESAERPPGELIFVGDRFRKSRPELSPVSSAAFAGLAVRDEVISKKK